MFIPPQGTTAQPVFQPNSMAQNPNYSMLNQQAQNQFMNGGIMYPSGGMIQQGQPFQQYGQGVPPVAPIQQPVQIDQQGQNFLQGLGAGAGGSNSGITGLAGGAGQALGNSVQGTTTGSALSGLASLAGCCFIMIEGHNGYLPWFIRPLRDLAYIRNPQVGQGYKWMAKWLCPLMRKSNTIKSLVNILMVSPLTEHCGYISSVTGCIPRTNYQRFWFKVWSIIGNHLT